MTILLWIGGYKGIEILRSMGLIEEEKHEVQPGSVITKFNSTNDFIENIPNEVTFIVENPSKNNGIRLKFLGLDAISPPLVELPIPAKGTAEFKTSITPAATGTRNILAVAYPLFGEDGKFIDENTAEPYSHQSINYQVQSQTQIGISKDQESKLKKLIILAVIFAGLIYSSGFLIQDYIQGDILKLIENYLPFLLALQAPFIYAYFYLQNKTKIITMDMEDILEQISAIDVLSDDLNSKLDKTFLKSSKYSKNLTNVMKVSIEGITGGGVFGQINTIISDQIKDINIEKLLSGKSDVLNSVDMNLFTKDANEFVNKNYSSKITD